MRQVQTHAAETPKRIYPNVPESCVDLNNAVIGDLRKPYCAPGFITAFPCLPWKHLPIQCIDALFD
jgi:hypothetical protein